MTRAATARRLATGAAVSGGGVGLAGAVFYALLREEARAARRKVEARTSKDDPPSGDGSYGRGRGKPLVLTVLGDSSAVGLGVERATETPGVLVAAALAELAERPVRLVRLAVSGAVSRDLHDQVDKALTEQPDVALIMIGANDVTSRTRPAVSVGHLAEAVRRLTEVGCEVVVGTCPDLGTIRPIAQPLRTFARRWSREMAAAQTVAVVEAGGRTVSLGSVLGPAFASDRSMFSVDEFHPSALGYAQAAAVLLPSVADAVGVVADSGPQRPADPPWHRAPGRPGGGPRRQPHRHRGAAGRAAWVRHRTARPVGAAAPPPPHRSPDARGDGGVGGDHRRRLKKDPVLPTPRTLGAVPWTGPGRRRYRGVVSGATRRPPTDRGPASSWRIHARSRHRRHRPLPHRSRLQGIAEGSAPRRPGRHHRARRPGQGARARPARHRRPDARLRPARRRAGLQHGARRGDAARHGPPAGHDHHPLLLLLAADHPHGHARHQGRRGRCLHLGGRGDGVPVREGQQRLAARHEEPRLRRRGGAGRQGGRERRRQLARPARGRRDPRCLHRDGPDRGEPGAAQGRLPAGDGRVRRAQPEPGRGGDQQRLLGARDHAGDDARRHRRQQGRRPAGRHHAGGTRLAEAGVPSRRAGDGGQRLPAQRRRRCRGRHERHQGRASWG